MAFNGSGVFVINSSGQPVVANTVISSTVFNALTADLATGLSTCITKDGQTTPTANIPMGTFKFTNLGNGSAATDSATLGQVQASTTKLVTVSGTDTITGTMTPALTAYASGQMFYFVAGGANTGAVTLNIDGLGARNVTRHGSVALVAGDILSGEVCVVVYDGTRFQLLNPASYTNLNVTGVLSLAAGTALLPSLAFSGDPNTGLWSPAADTIAASTGGSERLRVDSSGNVGIGTAGPSEKLEVSGTVAGALATRIVNLSSDSAAVTRLAMFTQGGTWNINANRSDFSLAFATGTTERMRLDSSGNLGIGTASPGYPLHVVNAANGIVAVQGGSGTNQGGAFFVRNAAGSGTLWGFGDLARFIGGTPETTATVWTASAPLVFHLNGSEAARFTGGNLGIGTASPGYRLDASTSSTSVARFTGPANCLVDVTDGTGTLRMQMLSNEPFITSLGSFAMRFGTNNTERMRIDANGNIVAGASAALATTATNGFLYVPTCAGTPTGTPTSITGMAPIVVNTTNNKLYFYSGGAWRDAGP